MTAAKIKRVMRSALKLFGYQIAVTFLGLMITPMLMDASDIIRIPVIAALLLLVAFFLFMDGAGQGEMDAAKTEALKKLEKAGKYDASPEELAGRFSRTKGVLTALIAALPFTLIALYVSLTTTPYVYSLQDVPSWLMGYLQRPEIGAPLQYTSHIVIASTLTDYFRVVIRLVLFPFVALLGSMSDEVAYTFDRLSPVLTLLMPMFSAIGYQFGPMRRAKTVKMMEKAKNTPRKRLKKSAKERSASKEKKHII